MAATFTQPTPAASGVAKADELTKGADLARWTVHELLSSLDTAALKIGKAGLLDADTPVVSNITEKVYLSATGTGGNGSGTLADPYQIESDGAGLQTAISNALSGASGDVAIFIDNALVTANPIDSSTVNTGTDVVHFIGWDQSGSNPSRLPVFDAFVDIDTLFDTGQSWTETGTGTNIYEVVLASATNFPVMFRVGDAGQHVHDETDGDDVFYSNNNVSEVDDNEPGQNRFHFDSSTRKLTIKFADLRDPSTVDLRASVAAEVSAFDINGGRVVVDSIRMSGFDPIPGSPEKYNIQLVSGDDNLYLMRRVRSDFTDKHAAGLIGLPGGPADCRAVPLLCEFGFGYHAGVEYNGFVAFSGDGGQYLTDLMNTYRTSTTREGGFSLYSAASIMHTSTGGADTSKALISIGLDIDSKYGSVRWGNRSDGDATEYEVRAFSRLHAAQDDPQGVQNPWDNNPLVGCDVRVSYPTTAPRSFQAVDNVGTQRVETRLDSCYLKLDGDFTQVNNGRNAFYAKDDYEQHFQFTARSSLIDLAITNARMLFNPGTDAPIANAVANETNILDIQNCAIRGSSDFFFVTFNTVSDLDKISDFTGSVLIGSLGREPTGITKLTESAWQGTDPTQLNDGVATAWLIDQAGLLAAARAMVLTIVDKTSATVPVESFGADDCKVGVSVIPSGTTATDAALASGQVGTVDPATGGTVNLSGQTGDVYVYAVHESSGLIRFASGVGSETLLSSGPRFGGRPIRDIRRIRRIRG